jgi:hypothetical protein
VIRVETTAISRTGQGAGAWYLTCCYWFCGANGAGRGCFDSIGKAGFGRLSNATLSRVFWVNVRASSRAGSLPHLECAPLWERACSRRGQPRHHNFLTGNKKPTNRWAPCIQPDDQNNFIFGASSFSGSFCAVCAFQPPPRALYRLTALVSCARRSVISACCALNS